MGDIMGEEKRMEDEKQRKADQERAEKVLEHLKSRFFRKVMAFPEKAIVHDGDCEIYRIHICTCGLFHQLKAAVVTCHRNEEFDDLWLRFQDDYYMEEWMIEHIFWRADSISKKYRESKGNEIPWEEMNKQWKEAFGQTDHKALQIFAEDEKTEIWLGDSEGNYVQKEIGKLETSLLPDNYVVHFGLKSEKIPLPKLEEDVKYYEKDLREQNDG